MIAREPAAVRGGAPPTHDHASRLSRAQARLSAAAAAAGRARVPARPAERRALRRRAPDLLEPVRAEPALSLGEPQPRLLLRRERASDRLLPAREQAAVHAGVPAVRRAP